MALRTIVLKGRGIRDEALAAGTITPGYLIQRDSADKVIAHNTAAGIAQKMFAVENELVGKEITVDYLSGDTTLFEHVVRGGMVNALLPANAAAIVIGDQLESAGDGTLRIIAADVAGVRAKVTFGLADAAVEFEAAMIGDEGNDITIEYLTATAAAQTVVVTGNAIVIKPDDTTPGTTDQADDIISLINGDAEASALVVAREGDGGDGTDAVVEPVAETNLAGGLDTTTGQTNTIAFAREAVDNSAGGTEVRIKVEVL